MSPSRLTTSQALVRYLMAQQIEGAHGVERLFAGVFAIFGHGNVAGLGEALEHVRDSFPTFRAHNEQGMAHAAIAFAKANQRRRMMACTTSIGPGATNMVTAAALAHVNRLPVLLLPGDTFASRAPDPVLQQVECFGDPTITANDCFRPVSRYWDRIVRPEQLLSSLPHAMSVLTDPVDCGPVTLALPQDVQAEAFEFPPEFFAQRVHRIVRPGPDEVELAAALTLLRRAERPLIIAGGGVHYSLAFEALVAFASRHGIPVAETQAGKGALPWDHALNAGAIGVTGTSAANALAASADLIVAIGTRLQDFTTGSRALFRARVLAINVARHDVVKHGATALRADAKRALESLSAELGSHEAPAAWRERVAALLARWNEEFAAATSTPTATPTATSTAATSGTTARSVALPSDAEVLALVNRNAGARATVVCAAGGLPGELHKLWRASGPCSYHVEYGYSCMGYEIAGALGVKMAHPERDVIVLVGDGSYLMMNAEIATSIALGLKLVVVLLDNRGYGCINRLQHACGGAAYNNLLDGAPVVDFVAHAAALGAHAEKAMGIESLPAALARAMASDRTSVVVIDTDPSRSTQAGGAWWEVPVAEVSTSDRVREARRDYERHIDER